MDIDCRKFDDLIQTDNDVDQPYRSMEDKGCNKAEGNGETPHGTEVTFHIEFGISTGTKDTVQYCGIYGLSHEVKAQYDHHKLKIASGSIRYWGNARYKWRQDHEESTGYDTDNNGDMRDPTAIILGFFQLVGTQQIPDQNTGAGTHATDDALHHAFYDTGNGIGGNCITAHVSQDDGVEDKGDAPDKGSTKDRCGIVPEILGQSAVSMRNASPADGNVATAPYSKISPNQFYNTGCDRGVSGADDAQTWCTKKAKDQDGIETDIDHNGSR